MSIHTPALNAACPLLEHAAANAGPFTAIKGWALQLPPRVAAALAAHNQQGDCPCERCKQILSILSCLNHLQVLAATIDHSIPESLVPPLPQPKTPAAPYGWAVRVSWALVSHRRLDVRPPPQGEFVLYRTGKQWTVREWALKQERVIRGQQTYVVGVLAMNPLTREEYQAARQQGGR